MSKPNGRRLKLQELRAQGVEALKHEPGFDIELDNGEVITIPHPMLVDDEVQASLADADGPIALAKMVLGEEEHAKFLAGGGHSNDVALAWNLLRLETEQAGPTRAR